jgi:DNA-binding Xre family transcriptional regulator
MRRFSLRCERGITICDVLGCTPVDLLEVDPEC